MIYDDMITDDQFEEFMIIYGDRLFGKQTLEGDYEMSDKPCGYTLAGVDTFASLMDRFIKDFPGYITPDNMREFISKSVDKIKTPRWAG
jgi:hypothetical protein